jgi:hypothetical protein
MKTYTFTLNESQLSSLKAFMERTELNGREVHKFIEIVQIINESEKGAANLASLSQSPESSTG